MLLGSRSYVNALPIARLPSEPLSYQSQVASMAEQVMRLKENYAEVVAILKRNSDGPMHEEIWKREAEEKEQERRDRCMWNKSRT